MKTVKNSPFSAFRWSVVTLVFLSLTVMVSAASPPEAVGQAGTGSELVRLIRSGNVATLEIGPVTPNAFLPLLILPDGIEDPSDADAALADGASVAGEFQADPNGMFEISYPMDSVNTSLRIAAYSRVQGNVTYLGTFVPNPMHESFQPPPRKPLGPVTIEVHPSEVIVLNGPGPEDDQVLSGGNYPLITALRAATPGSDPVFGIYGAIPGDLMQIGAGDSDSKGYVAHWGPVPMRFSVVGMTPDAKIGELGVRNRMNNGTVHGGVVDARFENLTIEARYNMAVGGGKGERFGILRFYDVHFATSAEGLASGAHSGFGYKWGVRIRALGRYDFRNCSFDPVLEHAIYVDSPQGDSYFQGIEHNGSTRTAIQIVNRAFDTSDPNQLADYESGVRQVQPSGYGRLLIEDVTIRDLRFDGGSAITVAGHPGDVFIRNINAVDLQNTFHGAVVVYTDAGFNHGAYLHTGGEGNLHSTYSLSIKDLNVNLPFADRTHVGISGIEFVRIHDFSIAGSRTAIALDSWFNQARFNNSLTVVDGTVTRTTAWINNGSVEFCVPPPLSQYPGFDSASKIADSWFLDAGGSHRSNILSNAQIDAIWPNAGCAAAPTSSSPFVVDGVFVLVPNVMGLTQAAAETAITDEGLGIGAVIPASSDTAPAGQVINQVPAAQAPVAPGSAVDLVVSSGPAPTATLGIEDSKKASKGCFIATAAYGSPLAKEIGVLRQFRDRYLLRSSLGQQVVHAYYEHSPPLAGVIAANQPLRTGVRVILTPVVWWADLALVSPALALLLGVSCVLAGLVLLHSAVRTSRHWRASPARLGEKGLAS